MVFAFRPAFLIGTGFGRKGMNSKRLLGLDIYRIILAIVVLAFHSNMHFGCDYGFLNPYIKMGGTAMTGFFLLSGYSNYYAYAEKDMSRLSEIKKFYKKKAVGILPSYYITALIYVVFLGGEPFMDNVVLAPMEILGIQSVFSSTFGLTHNGGTWFVSCILLSYSIFPFLAAVIRQMKRKSKICLLAAAAAVLLYAPFLVARFELNGIYPNPFFRIIEFMLGMILASLAEDIKNCRFHKVLFHKAVLLGEGAVMILGVTAAYRLGIAHGNHMLYSWICLPAFMLIVVGMAGTEWNGDRKIWRIILYFSKLSYDFFLVQLLIWLPMKTITNRLGAKNNLFKIVFSLLFCTAAAAGLHELLEKPLKKFMGRFLERKRSRNGN